MHKNGKGNIGATQPPVSQTATTASVAVSASEAAGGNVENNHRRFSNLSNLAQSLPSNSSSASALAPVTGSYDYLTSYKGKCFTYVPKTIANLTTYSRKLGDYNDTIIFEIDVMKNSFPINLNLCQT